MSLQYRTRDMSGDRKWERRLRLFGLLLLDLTDSWCISDDPFPFDFAISSTLYLFSPRCDPHGTRESGLASTLQRVVQPAEQECSAAVPNHTGEQRAQLIGRIHGLLTDQITGWENGDTLTPASIGALAQSIVDTIIVENYVKFHRTQTTSRDHGGFHGLW